MRYIIEEGKHYAKFTWDRLFPFASNKRDKAVLFDDGCLTPAFPSGLNKLDGISGFRIHKNSGRLVWIANGSLIAIYGYVYKDGVRTQIKIGDYDPEGFISYSIEYVAGQWHFHVNNDYACLDGKLGFFKFRCFPYFGGRAVAPCDIILDIL